MKNFSAKNAEFETLKINNEAAITSANIGTDPNKIPLNKDLGSLAYQDAVNLDDVSADMLELRAIAAEISDSAVDVFVYDTSRDSDGGAWRKRTQHTSWYSEELNTATRGGRREFPAVAVIVAEASKVTIYDGDDPDMGMWMVFTVSSTTWFKLRSSGNNCSCISALNGILCAGGNGSGIRLAVVDFVKDNQYLTEVGFTYYNAFISTRNNATTHIDDGGSRSIVNSSINDIAMTVLPNAPIDENTGLPVPTIAVATDGGVSVIKDDGTVVDLNVTGRPYSSVYFSGNMVWAVENPETNYDLLRYFEIPASDITIAADYGPNSSPALFPEYTKGNVFDSFNYGSPIGITKLDHENSMVAYTTSKYNTGWMPGDIKLAALSDTTVENIGVNSDELVVDSDDNWVGNFNDASDLDSWTESNGGTKSLNSSVIKVVSDTQGDRGSVRTVINTIPGRKYSISAQLVTRAENSDGFITIYNGDVNSSVEIVSSYPNAFDDGSYINLQFVAQSEQSTIRLVGSAVFGHFTEWDNISVKQTTELITNGDFSNGDDGSWTDYSSTNLTTSEISTEQYYLGSNSWKFVTSLANSGISQSHGVYTEQGRLYTLSGYVYSSTGKLWLRWRNGNDSGYIVDNYTLVSGTPNTWLAFSLTAKETGSGTLGGIRLVANAAGTFYVDGLSIRPAEEDRSVNNNGLQIIGEINKTPVAPGADLVAYSGFSENNYLIQPYNEDLNFGTGDFCVMGWIKDFAVNGDFQRIFSRGIDGNTGAEWDLYFSTQVPEFRFRYYINGSSMGDAVLASVTDMNVDSWNQIVFSRKDDVVQLHINGSKVYSDPFQFGPADLTNTNARLYVGNRFTPSNSSAFNGSIALARISVTSPTDAQIAKIYRDEKALFQDGAQATLHGTSDAVTALAYDDKTELLHVGTSSGRSDFSGLRRINNTTTAVTTSISAHNNLIAEQ